MQYAFQDSENLYLVMDLLTGGDLRFHVSKIKKFNEEQTSIIIIKNRHAFFFKYNLFILLIKINRILCLLHCTWIRIFTHK